MSHQQFQYAADNIKCSSKIMPAESMKTKQISQILTAVINKTNTSLQIGMCRISAPTPAGAESGRFQQIWSNLAPAA